MKSYKKILNEVIDELVNILDELEYRRDYNDDFCTGEIYGFIEALEIIREKLRRRNYAGLDFDIEKKFPLD